ncbi:MAG: hypothetical protein HY851_05535 [candidate division Zixibacteria bacterium]|nr:hypothetical protein [candidate division Zixibacteria bacterium]
MNPDISSSPTNWIAIEYASGFLLVFLAIYFPGTQVAKRYGRKKWAAALSAPSRDVGGKPWWPTGVTPLLVLVVTAYLAWVLYFLGYRGTRVGGIAFGLLALGVAISVWIWPFVAKLKAQRETGRRNKDDGQGPQFPGDDEADYRVVSPYEPPDSGNRPWWRRRRGSKDSATV